MERKTNPFGWPTWLWRGILAVAAVVAIASLPTAFGVLGSAAGLWLPASTPGYTAQTTSDALPGWSEVLEVRPGGPASVAGIEPGDHVRPARPAAIQPALRAGDILTVTVERDGRERQMRLRMQEEAWSFDVRLAEFLRTTYRLIWMALGVLLLVRRHGRQGNAAALLGLLLLAFGSQRGPPWWAPGQTSAALMYAVNQPSTVLFGFLFLFFCLEISTDRPSARQRYIVLGMALALFVPVGIFVYANLVAAALPLFGTGQALLITVILLRLSVGLTIIAWNYAQNDLADRNRIKIVSVSLVFLMLAGTAQNAVGVFGYQSLLSIFEFSMSVGASALLAYAVLRHKLFDLNFALNRTLVYASVSFVLLAAFGLAKWVIEHLIPESWQESSEYYSVGIALVLFLVLHRIHDSVERAVERFVFSPWHRNEQVLRRFVGAAGHFDQTPVLCRAFTEEVGRFARGAGTALYLRQSGGAYAQACGTLAGTPPEQAADDLALALMRAERRPVRTAETRTTLPGALALPMLDHGKLAGFVLLDRKPDGADYRPDEVEVLGWAAHQVGLDLQAMHAGELEAEIAGLNARVASLTEERDRLGALLAGSSRFAEGHAGLQGPGRKPRQRKEKVEKVTG